MDSCYAGTEKTQQKACRSHKEDKGRDFSAPWGCFISPDSNIWGRFLLEKCKLYCFISPFYMTKKACDRCGSEMKSRMSSVIDYSTERRRPRGASIKHQRVMTSSVIYSLRASFAPSTLFFPFKPLSSPSVLGPLCLSLFHAKANMSRRNRFSRWLWSCCYDSFICLSHILLSAAVTPQHASN